MTHSQRPWWRKLKNWLVLPVAIFVRVPVVGLVCLLIMLVAWLQIGLLNLAEKAHRIPGLER
jgi:hypothetical protein